MGKAAPVTDKRNDVIDAFRGIAVVSVMAFHYLVRWAPPENPGNVYGYRQTFSPLFAVGALGVDLFFVISGLVIAMTVLRSRDAIEFMARRVSRLYPPFIAAVLLTFTVTSTVPIAEFKTSWSDLLATFTMDPAELHHRQGKPKKRENVGPNKIGPDQQEKTVHSNAP
jgi:peptidoglycan/LPS O-acetylase OafA/YrhL